MKKIFIVLLLLFSCNKNKVIWFDGTFTQALKNDPNKIFMGYFYTDW
jgi:hypothetical protein|tara:strand:- start:672 stop:812 length:141 start_codon:yes stop_codon:yes gene_type:complete